MKAVWALPLVALLAAGCDSSAAPQDARWFVSQGPRSSPSDAFQCDPLGGGSAEITTSCVNCSPGTFSDVDKAIDTDILTPALIDTYSPTDSTSQQTVVTLTAKAQNGIVFPELTHPGVAMQGPMGFSKYYVTVFALLNGEIQGSHIEVPKQDGNGNLVYFGFTTGITKPFDALQLVITETQPSVEHHIYKAFEFCASGALK